MTDREWIFPDKLQCFNPAGTKFEEVFKNPVALIAFAQYKRKHIVSNEENEWLPQFALDFAAEVHRRLTVLRKITLEDAVQIWEKYWDANPRSLAKDEIAGAKWKAMLEPILPFLSGEKFLTLVKERVPIDARGHWEDQWFLKIEQKKETVQ
jgi:hypothetical protein